MSSCIDKYSRREIILKALSNKDGGKGVDIFEECYKEKTDDLNAKIGYSYGFFYGEKTTTTPEVYICCFYEDEYDVFLYDDGKPGSNFEFDCLLIKEYFAEKNYNKNSPFYKLKCKFKKKEEGKNMCIKPKNYPINKNLAFDRNGCIIAELKKRFDDFDIEIEEYDNCATEHIDVFKAVIRGKITLKKDNLIKEEKGYICAIYNDIFDVYVYDNYSFDVSLEKDWSTFKKDVVCATTTKTSPFYELKCKSEKKIKNKINDCDKTKTTPKDNINPNHYKSGKYECIEEMIQMFGIEAVKNFCMCNVYKYRYRANQKNGEEDIKKAEKYMEFLMNLDEYGTVHIPETTNNNK